MVIYLYILIYSILSAYFNYRIIEQKDFHVSQAILRVFAFCGILFLGSNDYFDLFRCLTIYWIVFDITLNIFRGLPLLYVGKTSYIDKKLGKYIYIFKVLFIIISVL